MKDVEITVRYQLWKFVSGYLRYILSVAILGGLTLMIPIDAFRVIIIILIVFLLWLPFRGFSYRMKTLKVINNQIVIRTFLGREFVITPDAVRTIRQGLITIHYLHRVCAIAFPFALNQTDILLCFLDAIKSEDITKSLESLQNPNVVIFGREDDFKSFQKLSTNRAAKLQKFQKVIFWIGMCCLSTTLILVVIGIITSHWPVIWTIGLLLTFGLFIWSIFLFDTWLESLQGRVKRFFANTLLFITCLAISVIISLSIYYLLLAFGVNLLLIRF